MDEWRGPGFEDSFSTVADKRPMCMCITAMEGTWLGSLIVTQARPRQRGPGGHRRNLRVCLDQWELFPHSQQRAETINRKKEKIEEIDYHLVRMVFIGKWC